MGTQMKKISRLLVLLCLLSFGANAQSIYFPPAAGSWDTLSPQRYGWCNARIDSLYNYLQVKNSKSFILLVNGKIVLEKLNYVTVFMGCNPNVVL